LLGTSCIQGVARSYIYTALPRQEWKLQLSDIKNNSVDMMEYDLGFFYIKSQDGMVEKRISWSDLASKHEKCQSQDLADPSEATRRRKTRMRVCKIENP